MVFVIVVAEYGYCIVFQLVLNYSRSSSFKQYLRKMENLRVRVYRYTIHLQHTSYVLYLCVVQSSAYRTLFIFL